MNRGLIIGVIVVLVVVSGTMGYAYMGSVSAQSSLNSKVSSLNNEVTQML